MGEDLFFQKMRGNSSRWLEPFRGGAAGEASVFLSCGDSFFSKERYWMAKRRRRTAKTNAPVRIILINHISAEEMRQIITDGLLAFEEQKKQQKSEEKASKEKAWRDAIKVKDFSEVQYPKRWLLQICNSNESSFEIMCYPPEGCQRGWDDTYAFTDICIWCFFSAE